MMQQSQTIACKKHHEEKARKKNTVTCTQKIKYDKALQSALSIPPKVEIPKVVTSVIYWFTWLLIMSLQVFLLCLKICPV